MNKITILFLVLLIFVLTVGFIPCKKEKSNCKKNFICIGVVIVILLSGFIPIKISVRDSELEKYDTFHIIKATQVTGASWKIIGDEKGYYDEPVYIDVKNLPFIAYDYELFFGDNIYVFCGNITNETEIDDVYQYEVNSWDIKYPIKRNSLLDILPEKYICIYDLIF